MKLSKNRLEEIILEEINNFRNNFLNGKKNNVFESKTVINSNKNILNTNLNSGSEKNK